MEKMSVTIELKLKLSSEGIPLSWAARETGSSYQHFHGVMNGRRPLSRNLEQRIKKLLRKMNSPVAA